MVARTRLVIMGMVRKDRILDIFRKLELIESIVKLDVKCKNVKE